MKLVVMLGRIMSKFLKILAAIVYLYIPICGASEVTHPPTFQQMKDASDAESHNSSAVYEALKYTENDVNLLISQNIPDYIIGAAYQYDKPKTISFLKDHFALLKNRPAGLSLFISCALQEYENLQNINFEELTEMLIKADPENSCSYYLKAYYFSKLDNTGKCLSYVKKANRKTIFNNYFTDLSNISIDTSLFLGYSKFVAQNYALGLQHDIMIFSGLSKYLTHKALRPEFKIECLKMGVILRNNSKTLLNDLLSYAVQLRALKDMKGKESEVRAVEKNKKDSMKVLEIAHAIEDEYDISENRQVEYFNDLYSQSETYAILKLIKEFPVNIQ